MIVGQLFCKYDCIYMIYTEAKYECIYMIYTEAHTYECIYMIYTEAHPILMYLYDLH